MIGLLIGLLVGKIVGPFIFDSIQEHKRNSGPQTMYDPPKPVQSGVYIQLTPSDKASSEH